MDRLHGCSCKEGTWEAWINQMPPNRNKLHVEGICTCPKAGYTARLRPAVPPGINPDILILNLETDEPSGGAADIITDYPVEYEEENAHYKQVTILPSDITIDVSIAS